MLGQPSGEKHKPAMLPITKQFGLRKRRETSEGLVGGQTPDLISGRETLECRFFRTFIGVGK
jgi:hypothetical protein